MGSTHAGGAAVCNAGGLSLCATFVQSHIFCSDRAWPAGCCCLGGRLFAAACLQQTRSVQGQRRRVELKTQERGPRGAACFPFFIVSSSGVVCLCVVVVRCSCGSCTGLGDRPKPSKFGHTCSCPCGRQPRASCSCSHHASSVTHTRPFPAVTLRRLRAGSAVLGEQPPMARPAWMPLHCMPGLLQTQQERVAGCMRVFVHQCIAMVVWRYGPWVVAHLQALLAVSVGARLHTRRAVSVVVGAGFTHAGLSVLGQASHTQGCFSVSPTGADLWGCEHKVLGLWDWFVCTACMHAGCFLLPSLSLSLYLTLSQSVLWLGPACTHAGLLRCLPILWGCDQQVTLFCAGFVRLEEWGGMHARS